MFTYARVDCKLISSYEVTNGVYQRYFLLRPGCRCVVLRCRGDVCVCVCVWWVFLLGGGGGGGLSRDAF